MKGNFFFCKNNHHIGVVHVPSFHLSARSFSFFRAFFLHLYGEPFMVHPIPPKMKRRNGPTDQPTDRSTDERTDPPIDT